MQLHKVSIGRQHGLKRPSLWLPLVQRSEIRGCGCFFVVCFLIFNFEVTCAQVWWPILGICALHLTHPSAHTHCEHTPGAVGSQCCGARGAVGGSVSCSRVSPQSWYWRWRECWTFTPPTDNSCRTRDSNPQSAGFFCWSCYVLLFFCCCCWSCYVEMGLNGTYI